MENKVQAGDGSNDAQSGKSKRPRLVAVEIIRRDKKSVLCAWMDGDLYKRAFVPANKLKGNDVDTAALAKCPTYGLDWAAKFAKFSNADEIANDLRRRGIWTADDFKRGRAEVVAALQRTTVNPLLDKIVKEF